MNTLNKGLILAAFSGLWACSERAPAPAAPTITSFAPNAAQAAVGDKVTLTWEVQNASTVQLTELGSGPIELDASAASGAVEVPITGDSVFVLTARGEGGSDSKLTAVTVDAAKDRLLLVASPSELAAGQSATLVWAAAGAQQVSLRPLGGQPVDLKGQLTSGSVIVSPSHSTTYELEALGKKVTASIRVSPVIASFKTTPQSPAPGQAVELHWKVNGATKLSLARDGAGILTTISEPATILDGTLSDTIPSTLPANGLVTYRLLAEGTDGTSATEVLTVYAGANPVVTKFEVPSHGKVSGSFVATWATTGADKLELLVDGTVVYQAPNGASVLSGSVALPTPAQSSTVTLRATHSRGGVTTAERTIEPVGPIALVEFKASSTALAAGGDPVTLSWNVTNARSVTITELGQHPVHRAEGAVETGSVVLYPSGNAEYELTAHNGIGESIAPQTLQITVSTPATATFSPDPAPIGALVNWVSHTVHSAAPEVLGLPNVTSNVPGEAFIDISTTGNAINYSGPDTSPVLVTLPRPFTTLLYGKLSSNHQLSLSINGWFAFSASTITGPDNNTPFPNTALVPFAIAPYWDDLYYVSDSKLYWQLDADRLIVQWNEVEHDDYPNSRLTFQAQLYTDGRVTFAYKKLQGVPVNAPPSVGIVNVDETDALVAPAAPAEGATLSFFSPATLPHPIRVTNQPYTIGLSMPQNGVMYLSARPQLLPPGQLAITEVQFNSTLADGQWFEVFNKTANPIDLAGWTIQFAPGITHTLPTSLVVPPNDFVVLGQTATSPETVTADYAYGVQLVMPPDAGEIQLLNSGAVYASLAYSPSLVTLPGTTVQLASARTADMLIAPNLTELSCASATPMGTHGHRGTPKAANGQCPTLNKAQPAVGAFQPILATGNVVISSPQDEEAIVEVNLPTPVRVGGAQFSKLWVCANGFISLAPISNSYPTSPTTPSPSRGGMIAPFWTDLDLLSSSSGVAWQRMDPDNLPTSGDEHTIVSWENVFPYGETATGSNLNFQVKFFDSGEIEFHTGAMDAAIPALAAGSDATSWLEEPLGRAAFVVNVKSATPGIAPQTAYGFVWAP